MEQYPLCQDPKVDEERIRMVGVNDFCFLQCLDTVGSVTGRSCAT